MEIFDHDTASKDDRIDTVTVAVSEDWAGDEPVPVEIEFRHKAKDDPATLHLTCQLIVLDH